MIIRKIRKRKAHNKYKRNKDNEDIQKIKTLDKRTSQNRRHYKYITGIQIAMGRISSKYEKNEINKKK